MNGPEDRASDADVPMLRAGRGVVLAVLSVSLLLVVVDATVLHTVAPVISAQLRPSSTQLLWIIDVYSLVAAPLLLVCARLGDRFGQRRILLLGFVLFGLASLCSSLAPTPLLLVCARALLGVGGAMIMPATLALIRQIFTDPGQRATALGVWSAVASSGAVIGPLIGGALVEHFWWGAVFLINVPFMLVAVVIGWWVLPAGPRTAGGVSDVGGAVLAVFGVLSLVLAIKQVGSGTALVGVVSGAVGLVLLAWFVRRECRVPVPLLDVRLFARPAFSVGVGTVLAVMAVMGGLELFFAQYLQLVLGCSPFLAGARLLPMTLASIVGSLLGAPLVRGVGSLGVAGGGLLVTAASLCPLLLLDAVDRPWLLATAFAVEGLGLAVALTAASTALMGVSQTSQAGQAAAVEETSYELGSGLGIAVLGSVMTVGYAAFFPAQPAIAPELRARAATSLPEAYRVAERLPAQLGAEFDAAARTAFMSGLHLTVAVATGVVAAMGAVSLAVRGRVGDRALANASGARSSNG